MMPDREKIRRIYLRISEQTKDFLLSDKSREFFVFLFFFFVASAFWLLQTLNYDYETEFSVPLKLKNVPEDAVITTPPPGRVQLKLRDKGTVLFNYKVTRNFYPIQIDFEEYQAQGTHVRIVSRQLAKKIMAQFNASSQLVAIKPDTLDFYYATGSYKMVPVRLRGTLRAGREYYLSDTVFTPDSVKVYAPEAELEKITAAYTEEVAIDNICDTVRRPLSLVTKQGVKFVPEVSELMLPVDIYTEKTVEVPLQGINFPADQVLRVFPSKVQITFQLGLSRFRHITESDFHLYVDYEELPRLGTDKYTVKLHSVPEGVSNVRIYPPQVDFLIEQNMN